MRIIAGGPKVPQKLTADLAEALAEVPAEARGAFLQAILREAQELLRFYDEHQDMVIPEESAFQVPGQLGHYTGLHLIAEGTMGKVYEAWDPRRDLKVAIKTIKPEFLVGQQRRQRFWKHFIHEARICRKLNHPNIVAMIDYIEDLRPYIVFEFVTGQTLADVLASGPLQDPQLLLSLVSQICDALVHAHRAGVVHRDFKPSNILLTEDNHVKLSDFGIGKLVGLRSLTNTGFLGTPLYTSPEQITGGKVDNRADLFALTLTLHMLVTGRHPFRGETVEQTLFSIANKAPGLSIPHPRLGIDPNRFRQFMAVNLAKDPAKRSPSALHFYESFFQICG
jgi:serine/threonine-protein kinase